ncbi:metallophosphoesterase [Paenibacillus filicis]|uniref:Metallophosphoesterase n=1 Tax=Paenibacillus gyeongsangnamensis TaxID=3388067 RepID=A0ABT4Q6Y0_9BACL|nr:metallophosphoesterase [Paenibacillus filicis]MCZ8512628.1 metallophosphoesterase [Paenibacillus filicis]
MKRWLLSSTIAALTALSGTLIPAGLPNAAPTAARIAKPPVPRPEEPRLAFPVISDVHVQAWDAKSQAKLAAALQDLNRIRPKADALVINGDLTNGMPADYARLAKLLKQYPHPRNMLFSIGNHEFYKAWFKEGGGESRSAFPNGETEQASIERFLRFAGVENVYFERRLNGYTFIFLGSEQYRQSHPDNLEDAYLSGEQLQWLRTTLKKAAVDGKPIFVFLHQPLPYTVSGTSFCCVNNRGIIQHEELKEILSSYQQVIFFSGHTHWKLKLPTTLKRDGFTMVNSSAVVQPWTGDGKGGENASGPNESEGLYVEVYGDEVQIKGRDFFRRRWIPEAQFSLPIPMGTNRPHE